MRMVAPLYYTADMVRALTLDVGKDFLAAVETARS